MDKLTKTNYMICGMIAEYQAKQDPKLFNKIVGLKFKDLRLQKNITVEAIVEDNKPYFSSVYDVYKFEKGIKTDVSKLFALQNYFDYDVNKLFTRLGGK